MYPRSGFFSNGEQRSPIGINLSNLLDFSREKNSIFQKGEAMEWEVMCLNTENSPKRLESESVSCSVISNSLRLPWTVAHQALLSIEFSK